MEGHGKRLTSVRLTVESGPIGLFPTIRGFLHPSDRHPSAHQAGTSAGVLPQQAREPVRASSVRGRPPKRREQQPVRSGLPPLLEDSTRGFQAAAQFFPRFSDARRPGSPLPTVRMHTSHGKRLASALGAALSVATLTAFAVAPLTEEPPPHARIIEPVSLSPQALPTAGNFRREITISRGESVGSLLRKLGQQDMSLIDFVRRNGTARKLLGLTPGTTVTATLDQQNHIQSLSYPLPYDSQGSTPPQRLLLLLKNGKWSAEVVNHTLERRLVTRSAHITSTLFAATDAAGIPSAITARIAEVFGSDIDFHREVKKGDRLRLVYEMFVDPASVGEGQPGRILAIDIRRSGFAWALSHSAPSSVPPGMDVEAWQAEKARAPVRIQWDPERDLNLQPLPHRAIQIGLSGVAVEHYCNDWITRITDITVLAHNIHQLVQQRRYDEAQALLPQERPYPNPQEPQP